MNAPPATAPSAAVSRLVTFAHVADVDASLAFYALLGFTPVHTMKDGAGRSCWAMAVSGSAEIMFALASGPIDPAQQAVLFYMYTSDVAAVRDHLVTHGVSDGGPYCGQAGPNDGRRVVFNIARPHYMPAGEVRVADPDGYCILIGQLQ
ncbi:MAG TPA: VOC family protein [Phycisphaerales bacterium]|nr:VOC family protein [Phycisphaerales bacterium]